MRKVENADETSLPMNIPADEEYANGEYQQADGDTEVNHSCLIGVWIA
jgi:hypothetical protein